MIYNLLSSLSLRHLRQRHLMGNSRDACEAGDAGEFVVHEVLPPGGRSSFCKKAGSRAMAAPGTDADKKAF